MPDRAEIEAVTMLRGFALRIEDNSRGSFSDEAARRALTAINEECRKLLEADRRGLLGEFFSRDRVRDARGDDEGPKVTVEPGRRPFDPAKAARSPQGEDHECRDGKHEWAVSGDPATTCVRCGVPWASPSRDGTVAVEDVAPRVTELCRCGHQIIAHSATDGCVYCDCDERYVGSARAGESNEGGNQ